MMPNEELNPNTVTSLMLRSKNLLDEQENKQRLTNNYTVFSGSIESLTNEIQVLNKNFKSFNGSFALSKNQMEDFFNNQNEEKEQPVDDDSEARKNVGYLKAFSSVLKDDIKDGLKSFGKNIFDSVKNQDNEIGMAIRGVSNIFSGTKNIFKKVNERVYKGEAQTEIKNSVLEGEVGVFSEQPDSSNGYGSAQTSEQRESIFRDVEADKKDMFSERQAVTAGYEFEADTDRNNMLEILKDIEEKDFGKDGLGKFKLDLKTLLAGALASGLVYMGKQVIDTLNDAWDSVDQNFKQMAEVRDKENELIMNKLSSGVINQEEFSRLENKESEVTKKATETVSILQKFASIASTSPFGAQNSLIGSHFLQQDIKNRAHKAKQAELARIEDSKINLDRETLFNNLPRGLINNPVVVGKQEESPFLKQNTQDGNKVIKEALEVNTKAINSLVKLQEKNNELVKNSSTNRPVSVGATRK